MHYEYEEEAAMTPPAELPLKETANLIGVSRGRQIKWPPTLRQKKIKVKIKIKNKSKNMSEKKGNVGKAEEELEHLAALCGQFFF